ncbi:Receptor-like protein kinase ANXUR2, partial [Mucuna pruriens]
MFLKCLGNTSSSKRQYRTVIEELCHPFSLADLRKSTNNFDKKKLIGRGRFGEVYKGYLKHYVASNYIVAVKRFFVEHGKVFKNEIELLCQLRHPNCVSLIGFCIHKKEKIIVFEYTSNESLDKHLRRGELSWNKRLEICVGTARALHYLHTGAKRTIIHRNVKPRTILLDHNMQPKLAGFCISVHGSRSMSKPKPIKVDLVAGTPGYMARELFTDDVITDKCDVYSFGMVLLEVVCGRKYLKMAIETEFLEKPVEEKIDANIKGKIAPLCWQVFIDIAKRCVRYQPDERPTMGEVEVELEHALCLQEQADITNTNAHHTLSSKTIIHPGEELEYNTQDTDSEEILKKVSQIETMFLKCSGFWHSSSSQRQYPTVIQELCHEFSLADLRKSTNNFDENRVIGYGRFGKVYKGCLQHDASDYTVALKRLDVKDSRGWEQFKNEIELLCQLNHPNCVSLIGFCNHKKEKILVYEFMSKGSLHQHLRGGELSWKKRLEICIGAARGLHYLHTGAKRTIVHRNINPTNILLDNNMDPKIADFRLSVQGTRYGSKPKPIQVYLIEGTLGYMAMEYVVDGTITDKCDIFSFGMVLLEVACGRNCLIMATETQVPEKPEQAQITNSNCDYTLFTSTIIHLGVELESNTQDSDIEEVT